MTLLLDRTTVIPPTRRRRRPTWAPVETDRNVLELLFDTAAVAARLVDRRLQNAAKEADDGLDIEALGHSAFRVLILVEDHPGIMPTQIASIVHQVPHSISGMLNRLEAAGLIERVKPRTGDRRSMHTYVTDKGRMITARVRAVAGEVDAFLLAALRRRRGNAIESLRAALEEVGNARP